MYDAFISYSRRDLPVVQGLKRQLDERRLRVFLVLDSLRAGEDWPPQLGAAVQDSRMMVLCWSAQADKSDWVRAEINRNQSCPQYKETGPGPTLASGQYSVAGHASPQAGHPGYQSSPGGECGRGGA